MMILRTCETALAFRCSRTRTWTRALVKLNPTRRRKYEKNLRFTSCCLEKCGDSPLILIVWRRRDATAPVSSSSCEMRLYEDLCMLVRKISWWCRGSSAHPKDDTIVSSLLLQLIIKPGYKYMNASACLPVHNVQKIERVKVGGRKRIGDWHT